MRGVLELMTFPYQLLKALAEGVQMGLEIVGGQVDIPPSPDDEIMHTYQSTLTG